MAAYEIIVLDLDGTLTNNKKIITPRTKHALLEWQERGKKLVLASGRPTVGMMHLAEELARGIDKGNCLSNEEDGVAHVVEKFMRQL